ncbi:hypothetical protein AK812_SmicGene98 [Symbiodinium microadriaticum]|uniref:Uncharacterized protein n=1 Tax=Symbiodinium microadriaticum TaxID=2951 RepID=A0A1Q9F7F1_SYMMI|nr:hypothetical protein AK812_SmicGene98 [Symbiodinium microadriaticum]
MQTDALIFASDARAKTSGEVCTLVYARPVTRLPQQLLLHSAALGHPVVGDRLHDADRRLDFRFRCSGENFCYCRGLNN